MREKIKDKCHFEGALEAVMRMTGCTVTNIAASIIAVDNC